MQKQIVVIGLERFGSIVATTLAKQGHQVLGIDTNEKRVDEISDTLTEAVTAKTINEDTLVSLGVKEFDIAVVAINDVEESILVSQILKELKIKKVICKAQSFLHGRVLEKIGVDRIVFPELDMGLRLANSLVSDNIIDCIKLSEEFDVFEISAPEEFFGKTLGELNLRTEYNINVIAVKKTSEIIMSPGSDQLIEEEDILVVIGKNEDLNKIIFK